MQTAQEASTLSVIRRRWSAAVPAAVVAPLHARVLCPSAENQRDERPISRLYCCRHYTTFNAFSFNSVCIHSAILSFAKVVYLLILTRCRRLFVVLFVSERNYTENVVDEYS